MIFSTAYQSVYPVCFATFLLVCGQNACGSDDIPSGIYAHHFLLKQQGTEQCLVVVDEPVVMDMPSVYRSNEGEPTDIGGHGNRVVFATCDELTPGQRWRFDFQNKRIYSQGLGETLCLTRWPEALAMTQCQTADLTQLWFFNQQDQLFSRVDFSDPLALAKLLQPDTPSPVTFRFVDAEMGDDLCYLSPFTGRVECKEFAMDEKTLKQQEVKHWAWSGIWPWQPKRMKLTEDLMLGALNNNHCLGVRQCHVDSIGQYDCFGGAQVQVSACKLASHQIWRYDLVSKRLFNKQAGEQFCLSWLSKKLTLEHCLPGGAASQKWYFASSAGKKYSEKRQLRWFSNSSEHYDYVETLNFATAVKFEPLKKDNQGEWCGYDPIDGIWKSPCAY